MQHIVVVGVVCVACVVAGPHFQFAFELRRFVVATVRHNIVHVQFNFFDSHGFVRVHVFRGAMLNTNQISLLDGVRHRHFFPPP